MVDTQSEQGNIPPSVKKPLIYEWNYTGKEVLSPKDFYIKIIEKLEKHDILSVGEYHDENTDLSFDSLNKHENEILEAFSYYTNYSKREHIPFERFLRTESTLFQDISAEDVSFKRLKKIHPGRLFALTVLPLAYQQGYRHLILEGFSETDPARFLTRSKDKRGDLLRMVMAASLGFEIHGAYADGILTTPVDIAQAIFGKIKEIKERDSGRILVYNGALHNMTAPFSEGEVKDKFLSIDPSKISYAPQAIGLWGDRYGAIDLLNLNTLLPQGHFRLMQEQAAKDGITCYSHSVDQQTYIIN